MKSLLMHMSSLFSDEEWSPEGADHLDLTRLEGTRCYCDPAAEAAICQAIAGLPLRAVHWIDSGDYHYLSELWARKLSSPARLVLFDNHPDDQEPAFGADLLSCGGWVAHARRTNPLLDDSSGLLYISIDIDCLSRDYARTDWSQGETTLPQLLQQLDEVRRGHELAGVDICGGITLSQGGTAEDFAVNRRTRNALLEYFREV